MLVRVAQTGARPRCCSARARRAARRRAHGIERMRFALGVDDDPRPFLRRFARDPLIGRSVRAASVAARAPAPRSLRGARAGDLRAADRVRARRRDRAPRRRRARAPLGRLGRRPQHACRPAAAGAARRHARRRCSSPSTSRAAARSRSSRRRARWRAGASTSTPSATSTAGGRLRAIPGIGPWTVEMMALHGQGRHDQLPAGDLGLLQFAGRVLCGGRSRRRSRRNSRCASCSRPTASGPGLRPPTRSGSESRSAGVA